MTLPIWKTIELGLMASPEAYLQAIRLTKTAVGGHCSDLLDLIKCAGLRRTVNLVKLSGRDLGFDTAAPYREICEAALALGLELCPAEAALALRLQYPEQPRGEWIWVAMEPLPSRRSDSYIFMLERDTVVPWQREINCHTAAFLSVTTPFVFVKP